nr:fluoride efflux transporter CrcB [uncultured Allomuricauda sp.]
MKHALLVFLGGGIGSVLRYLIAKPLNNFHQHFYLGTFAVNVIGCLVIGIVMGLASKNELFSQQGVLFFATGVCGGFTTFSAFAFEKHAFLKQGDFLPLFIYLFSSIFLGVLAVALGLWITRITE